MGGLGNGRRGGRSPPLLIGALIACVLVLGFNYWVSSSRNLELQTQLFQMEGAARRAAAERAAVEQKKAAFEEQLRMQSDQIKRMEGSHRIQLDTMQANWKQEKTVLVLNISTSTRTIQILKAQLFGLEEIQKELQDCQNNRINLSTAMNQCEAQMSALKEECAAKTPEKPPPVSPSSQEKSGSPLRRTGLEEKPGLDDTKKPSVLAPKTSRTGTEPDGTNAKLSALETNEIAKAGEKSDITQQQPPVGVARRGNDLEVMETHAGKQQSTGNDVVLVEKGGKRVDTPEDKPEDKPGDKPEDQPEDKPGDQPEDQPEDKPEDKPGDEPGDKPEDKPGDKPGDQPEDQPEDKPGDKPGDQRSAAGSEAVKQTQLKASAGRGPAVGHALSDRKDKLADYNGDADNEGEFEADKQAELAKH